MLKKRMVTLGLIFTFLASALTGCSSSSSSNDKESTATNSGKKPIEIEFVQVKREAGDTFNKIIAEFEKTHSNIKIVQNVVPDAQEVLMTRVNSGQMPDLFTHWPTDAQYIQFANEGLLMDLSNKKYVSNIIDSYVENTKINNGLYILPLSLNFMGVYYNVDKFKKAGFKIPQTWDELIDIAKQIKERGEVAFMLPNKDAWTVSQLWSNIESKDIGAHNEIYQKMREGKTSFAQEPIYKKSVENMIQLLDYAQSDSLALSYDQAINDFANGQAYMFIQGSWALPSIKSANPNVNVSMFSLPNNNGNYIQTVGADCGFCVNAKVKDDPEKMEAIDQFLEFVFSKEGAQIYADNDKSPSCVKGVTVNVPEEKEILDVIQKKGVLDIAPLPTGFEDTKRGKIQNVLIDKNVDKFLKEMSEDFKEAVEQ